MGQISASKEFRQRGDLEAAKRAKKIAEDVRLNRIILFPNLDPYNLVGLLAQGRVVGVAPDHLLVEAMIPVSTGVEETRRVPRDLNRDAGWMTIGTGRMELMQKTHTVKFFTQRELKQSDDVSEIRCRLKSTSGNYVAVEVPEEELRAALQELRGK